jgi:hypothetical protein
MSTAKGLIGNYASEVGHLANTHFDVRLECARQDCSAYLQSDCCKVSFFQ